MRETIKKEILDKFAKGQTFRKKSNRISKPFKDWAQFEKFILTHKTMKISPKGFIKEYKTLVDIALDEIEGLGDRLSKGVKKAT